MKSVRQFVKEHRKEIDAHIERALGGPEHYIYRNDDERRLWLVNDETLYLWAKSEGAKVDE